MSLRATDVWLKLQMVAVYFAKLFPRLRWASTLVDSWARRCSAGAERSSDLQRTAGLGRVWTNHLRFIGFIRVGKSGKISTSWPRSLGGKGLNNEVGWRASAELHGPSFLQRWPGPIQNTTVVMWTTMEGGVLVNTPCHPVWRFRENILKKTGKFCAIFDPYTKMDVVIKSMLQSPNFNKII